MFCVFRVKLNSFPGGVKGPSAPERFILSADWEGNVLTTCVRIREKLI